MFIGIFFFLETSVLGKFLESMPKFTLVFFASPPSEYNLCILLWQLFSFLSV